MIYKVVSKFSYAALNVAMAIGLLAAALQATSQDSRAEMIRPGEAHLEDLAPPPEAHALARTQEEQDPEQRTAAAKPTETAPEPQQAQKEPEPEPEADPDAGKPWDGRPWLTRDAAPTPTSREQMLAAARLGASSSGPHSIGALATEPDNDPLLTDLRYWRNARYGKPVDWSDASSFLQRRGDWPALGRMRAAAERAMPDDLSPEKRIAFFGKRKPQTARGARLLGEALIAQGETEKGHARIVEAWRTLPAARKEEALYLKNYASLLAPHHPARFEALVWRRRLNDAQRAARNLPEGWDKLSDALAALYRSRRGVDGKIKAVPAALQTHPSLAHARMVWREKRRKRADAETALKEADASGKLGLASAWAKLRMRFARDAYEDGRHQEAAAMSSGHQLKAGVSFAELEWFAGWMHLKRLKNADGALKHFTSLWGGVETPISRSRAAYWAGEAAEAAGDPALAAEWRAKAAALSSAFYGQMAAETLATPPKLEDAPETLAPFELSGLTESQREAVAAADLLYAAGHQAEGRMFMKQLAALRADAPSLGFLARRANAQGDLAAEILVAKRGFEIDAPMWSSLFPIPPAPRFAGRRVEPALLLAIARQESRFMRGARSGVGAIGLMQMMPATARAAARGLKIKFEPDRLNADWGYNLSLSDAHMAGVLERYNGSYVLSVAAYNAGEGNVDKWIKRFGDPRDKDVDTVTWIESIPFGETRNYVQRVLEAAQIYRIRLGAADDLALNADLNR